MKNLILFLFLSTAIASFSQSKETKNHLKKIGYDLSELAYTNEKLIIYPRGLIYNVNEPDSVFYFGCISSDQKDISDYFEGKKTTLPKFALGNLILRGFDEYMDTIVMESLDIKLSQFKSNNGDNYTLKDGTKYVVMYYWRNDVFSKNFTKNFRYFKKYAREHPELNIQVIAVSTDKPN